MKYLRLKLNILTLTALLFSLSVSGQFFDKNNWKKNRHQVSVGFGGSNFLGDLGGKDDIGTNDFQDLEISQTKLAAFVGYKWTMYKKLYLRLDFTYGQLSGNDNLTREQFRQNRNLNFRSKIYEFDAMVEWEIPINFKKGHVYNIRGAKPWKFKASSFYLFGGIGAFNYNPQTNLDGQWIDLRPLRTEGQGLPDGPDEYGRWGICIPVGLAYSKRIGHQFSVGVELSYRYTFTDYIDDVSTEYYNPFDIALYVGGEEGDVAAYLSNPALGLEQDGLGNVVTSVGQQRGDPEDDDGFMYAMFKVNYLIQDQYKNRFNPTRKRMRQVKRRRSKKIIF
ncbi:MAG: DUF6089 family protein [Flavobacteriales bacterium]|nr:DUF6089 family protein [Flavobacteriales bacterium]MDG1780503.1 DUF6089 family protein [Flavobacteriales bacterium]